MHVVTIIWSTISAVCLTLALLHVAIWTRRRREVRHLLFSLAALAAAANAHIELLQMSARTVSGIAQLFILQNIAIAFMLTSLVWFVFYDFRTARRWLAFTITVLWGFSLLVNALSPYSITYAKIFELAQIPLPWGGSYAFPVAETNPLTIIPNSASILITIYLVDASWSLYRRSNKRRALIVGGSSVFFIVAAGAYTPLLDVGVLQTPSIISFMFLAIVVAISIELSGEIIRSSVLSREIVASEQRWRTLLENVEMLVVGVDGKGLITYVNPSFETSTGYAAQDLIGKSWFDVVVPEDERDVRRAGFERFTKGQQRMSMQNRLVRRDGSALIISWSIVRLRDGLGGISGALGIGADITRREELLRQITLLKDQLQEENLYLKEEFAPGESKIIGQSDGLRYALSRVEQVAMTDTSVLLQGETGVGKELFANEIHSRSPRKDWPLIRVDCATIPHSLVESELFGHEKGAYTGADRQRKGRFELADRGTIFLDEIGELPLELQPKLLRVLEEGEFERLGSANTIKVNTRIIASTNRDLKTEVDRGRFRQDLFYRLSVFPISIPPLRKRREDIPLLVESFVQEFSRKLGKKVTTIPRHSLKLLSSHDWPGNIRELRNLIEHAMILSRGARLVIPESMLGGSRTPPDSASPPNRALSVIERQHILNVLGECDWQVEGEKGAAKILGLHPNTLRNRLTKLGITRPGKSV